MLRSWRRAALWMSALLVASSAEATDVYYDEEESSSGTSQDQRPEADEAEEVEANGLAAPDSFEPESQDSEIRAELEEADQKDSDRGLEFVFVQGDLGVQYLHFRAPTGRVNRGLFSFGGALGVRLLYLTLAGRFTSTQARDFYSYSTSGELGFKFPIGALEPHLLLGVGYTKIAHMDAALLGMDPSMVDRPRMDGMNLRGGAGFDYFLSPTFSVGAMVSADWLRFMRAPASDAGELDSGSSGSQLRATFVIGLHI